MGNTVFLTLGEAAKATGKAKTTIQRAVKSGKVSGGSRGVNGEYRIDPSELFRVYPSTQHATGSRDGQMERDATPESNAPQQGEIDALKLLIEEKERTIDRLEADKEAAAAERENWRQEYQEAKQKLLTFEAQRETPEPPKRRWWQLGKG